MLKRGAFGGIQWGSADLEKTRWVVMRRADCPNVDGEYNRFASGTRQPTRIQYTSQMR